MWFEIVDLSKKKLLVLIVLVSLAFIGLLGVQARLTFLGIQARLEHTNGKINDLLLDFHHSVEDDKELSEAIIGILKVREAGNNPHEKEEERIVNDLRRRFDELSELYQIPLSFDFILYNTASGKVMLQSFEGLPPKGDFKRKTIKAGWRIRKALGEGKYRFGLHYYNQAGYLLRQVTDVLLLAVSMMLILVVSFIYVISALKKQHKINDTRNELINNLVHELKTPIFSSSVLHKLIGKNLGGGTEKPLEYLALLEKENEKLKSNIEKILEVATLESQSFVLKKEKVEVSSVLEQSLQRFLHNYLDTGIDLQTELIKEPIWVEGDGFHLSNVFDNLLENAYRYGGESPVVRVKGEVDDGIFIVKICDEGEGIAKDQLDKVFNKFYRVPSGDNHKVKGFGLGLSYSKLMVELHGGKIGVESKRGVGSCFTISLPLFSHNQL